ncbi:hypothetical protein ACW9KT_21800 [Hymenobacter sp. HD11105]
MNTLYQEQLQLTQVPCYPGYLRMDCRTAVADTVFTRIDSLARKLDWTEVLVYDHQHQLVRGNTGSM